MTGRTIARRLRARLDGERGFTLVETVVALVVIFGSLTALAYTATIGFRYVAYGRDRQQASAFANKVMEEIRGQPYAVIERGMSSSNLGGDSRIVNCSSVYRFESCSGPKLVHSAVGSATAPWIIPHSGTAQSGNLAVSWATYVTNDDPVSNPYAVTVFVSWSGGAIPGRANNFVRLQSDFWSPSGCLSTDTHPFSAPCQPFFYGLAEVPHGAITITGELAGSDEAFETGVVSLPVARAALQQEQVTAVAATAGESQVSFKDADGLLQEGAGANANASADTDPGSSAGSTAGATLSGSGGSLVRAADCCADLGVDVSVGAGQTGTASASTSASAGDANACPPSGTRENDALPCAAAEVRPVNASAATVSFQQAIGDALLARIGSAATVSKATTDRDAAAGGDGVLDAQASRVMPDLYLGGFPASGMTPLPNMNTDTTLPGNYCMRVTGYQDSAQVRAGTTTTTAGPTSQILAGTFTYYNGSDYSSLPVTDAALEGLDVTCSKTQVVGADTVQWLVQVKGSDPSSPYRITRAQTPAVVHETETDAKIKLDVESTVEPIRITFRYQFRVNGVDQVDLMVTVDPGVLRASGVYGPPPEAT